VSWTAPKAKRRFVSLEFIDGIPMVNLKIVTTLGTNMFFNVMFGIYACADMFFRLTGIVK
jgi:hypothetical protein